MEHEKLFAIQAWNDMSRIDNQKLLGIVEGNAAVINEIYLQVMAIRKTLSAMEKGKG